MRAVLTMPNVPETLTLAARKESELSDADVAGMIEDLRELGLLSAGTPVPRNETMALSPAERLLQDLGVTEPEEIDLDAIAYYVRASVRYRPLDGCEARIIGNGKNAIITVNAIGTLRRKRFSVAHELGHWHHHRGKQLVCRVDNYRPDHALSPERIADAFAADLLMPNYMFRPLSRQHAKLTFKTVNTLADMFMTSLAATAIRLVESDHSPAIVVCHGPQGRRWFRRAPSVPSRWFPQEQLDSDLRLRCALREPPRRCVPTHHRRRCLVRPP